MSTSVSSPLRRVATTCLLPSLGGAALAALCILCFVAVNQSLYGDRNAGLAVLSAGGQTAVGGVDVTRMSVKNLVRSATAHTQDAIMEEKRAAALKSEAVSARSKVAGLKAQLHELLAKEGERDHRAARDAVEAKQLAAHARKAALATGSIKEARDAALAAARAKRDAFLKDERLAGQSKAAALSLLDKERELFHASEKRINQEVKMQAQARGESQTLSQLRKQKRRAADHVAILNMHSKPIVSDAHRAATTHAKPSHIAGASIDRTGLPRQDNIKRPLWGNHKWPSYYKNVLTDKKLFSADAPSHPPAMLDRGDDDASMEAGHLAHSQRCDMNHPCGRSVGVNGAHFAKPARIQAMHQQAPHPAVEQQNTLQTTEAKAILGQFEADVRRMEMPLVGMEEQLASALDRDEVLRAHDTLLRKYAEEKNQWGALKQSKMEQREQQAEALEAEKLRVEREMGEEMRDMTSRLKTEEMEKVNVLEGALRNMEHEMRTAKTEHTYQAETDAVELAHRSEAEMNAALQKATSEEKQKEQKMQSEMVDLEQRLRVSQEKMDAEAYTLAHSEVQARESEAKAMQEEMGRFKQAQASLEAAMQQQQKREEEEQAGARASRGRHEEEEQRELQAAVHRVEAAAASRVAAYRADLAKRRQQVRALEQKVEGLEAQRQISKRVKEAEERLKTKMEGQLHKMAAEDRSKQDAMARDLKEDRRREARLEEEKGEKEERLAVERDRVKAADEQSVEALKFAQEKQVARQVAADFRRERTKLSRAEQDVRRSHAEEKALLEEARAAKQAARSAVSKEGAEIKNKLHAEMQGQIAQYEKKLAAQEKAAVAKEGRAMHRQQEAMEAQVRKAKEEAKDAEEEKRQAVGGKEKVLGSLAAVGGRQSQELHALAAKKAAEERREERERRERKARFESPLALAEKERAREEREERREETDAAAAGAAQAAAEAEEAKQAVAKRDRRERARDEASAAAEREEVSKAAAQVKARASKAVEATPGGEVERAFEAIFGGGDEQVIAAKAKAHAKPSPPQREEPAAAKAGRGEEGEAAVGRGERAAVAAESAKEQGEDEEDGAMRAQARALGFHSLRAFEKHMHVRPLLDDVRVPPAKEEADARSDPVPAEYANAVRAEQLAAQPADRPVKAFFNSGLSRDRAVPVGAANSAGSSWW